ncbi:MAG: periplasmic heavy metal sensor [Candidatus Obscuribacterales bacterium]|nr:periplasmic heavy metal sensor [Candidatus Obscuribacterales bacterium]
MHKQLLLSLSITLLAPLSAFANPPESNTQLIDKDFEISVRKFISKRFFNRINASDEQRDKLSKIFADTQEQTRPEREKLRQGMLELSGMIADSNTEEQAITNKVQNLRELHNKIMDTRVASALAARKILSPEQRQKIHGRISDLITGGARPKLLVGFLKD